MSSQESAVVEAQTLLSDLVIGESPRWHDSHTGAKGASVYHVRGSEVTRVVVYSNRERALADLGLTSEIGSSNA